MKIAFSNLGSFIDIKQKGITILRIENEALFTRICQSIISMKCENAIEPYTVWIDDACEINPMNAFIVIVNPFDLPWKNKSLMGGIHGRMEKELLCNEDLRKEIQDLGVQLESTVHKLDFQFNANYGFKIEWNLGSYLKAFSYEVDLSDTLSLLDNLISFVDLAADMSIDKVFVFINLKTFLTKSELIELQERLFFHKIGALLLENQYSPAYKECEQEYVVDRDFVEYVFNNKSDCTSSTQRGICSNGFGAVTF